MAVNSPAVCVRFARPKSTTCGKPSASSSTFDGFKSRCKNSALVGVMDSASNSRDHPGGVARAVDKFTQAASPDCRLE